MTEKAKGTDVARARITPSLRKKMERMKELDPDASDSDLVREGLALLAKKKGIP